jgi:hypothetical protein
MVESSNLKVFGWGINREQQLGFET